MEETQIREAGVCDSSAISELIQRTVRVSNAGDYSSQTIEIICENFSPEKVVEKMRERDVFVCIQQERYVGTISLGDDKLHSLFVVPEFQGNGIGTHLVSYVESHAVKRDHTKLRVSSSLTAKAFYDRLGYDVLKFEEREDGSTFLMEKILI